MKKKIIEIGNLKIGGHHPLVIISGPCQLESLQHSRMVVEKLCDICFNSKLGFIFKASFDKANRSSINGKRGPGIDEGLTILDKIKTEFNCLTLTDVHDPKQCSPVSEVVDVLQIPAFLCRQTDLLIASGNTGRTINVKKGQFLAPWDMENVIKKIQSTGNENILLCERGTTFGYNSLVVDFRSLAIMAATGYPVVYDATHSVQEPSKNIESTGGQREFVEPLSKAACALGISAIFIETHQDPANAPSDGPTMVPLSEMQNLISRLKKIDALNKS